MNEGICKMCAENEHYQPKIFLGIAHGPIPTCVYFCPRCDGNLSRQERNER